MRKENGGPCYVCSDATLMVCSNCQTPTCEFHLYVVLGELGSDDGPIECAECLHETDCSQCYSLDNANGDCWREG